MHSSTSRPTKPLLALETSGRRMSAALWGPQGLMVERSAGEGARHGAALAPILQELLESHGLTARELSAVGVSLGPGSWTGLRIGLAAAKALAWGAGVPLVGVPSLEVLAWGAMLGGGEAGVTKTPRAVLTLRHAYSEGLYVALFGETPQGPKRWMDEQVADELDLDALVEAALQAQGFEEDKPVRVLVCGDEPCLETWSAHVADSRFRLLDGFDEAPASALAERAWSRACAGEWWAKPNEIHAAAPMYLRKSDPELKLERKQR